MVNARLKLGMDCRADRSAGAVESGGNLGESALKPCGGAVTSRSKRDSTRLGWPRTLAVAFALLLIAFAIGAFWTIWFHPTGIDFVSFWSAGRMALDGNPGSAYNIIAHHQVELSAAPDVGLMPFPYPPPFLMVVTPFALATFPIAFILWILITGAFYTIAGERVAPVPYVLASPPVLTGTMVGQSSLLTGGMLIFGLTLLARKRFLAGAILGLLVIKPQLALMLPIAMLAGKQWSAIAGAILSSAATLLLALLIFGLDSYRGFFNILPHYVTYLQESRWQWAELASTFAFMRYFGISASASLMVHLTVTIGAALITATAWARDWDEKVPILSAATLLAPAYLLTYDAVLLIIPAGVLIAQKRFRALGLLWILCAIPVLHGYNLYFGPNTIPLACIAFIAIFTAPHFRRIDTVIGTANGKSPSLA